MIVDVHEVSRRFGKHSAVKDLSFQIPEGTVFGLLGPNGAGKTTTIRMITTLLQPTGGVITVGGCDVTKDPTGVRRQIGVVFQDPSHDEQLTAVENMRLHAKLYRLCARVREGRIEELLRMFDLWDRRDSKLKTYSGGMKRRLEIARGLLHTPRLLILDEPTLGLDPQMRHQLWSQVRALRDKEGVTVLLTTHYMSEVERVADLLAIIHHGALVCRDSPERIKADCNASSLEEAFMSLTSESGVNLNSQNDSQLAITSPA